MIISTKKYACETCIKGHRSSACKHTDRPLFEIKKKGRPVTQCEHCRELRKTKQVHVKCICESKAESSYSSQQGPKLGFESAAFPNGLPEALGASVAFQSPGEGTSSDSDHGGVHHGQCKSGDPCTCVTPRIRTRARGESDLDGTAAGGSSRRGAHGHPSSSRSSAHTSSQILARIQELRPLVPRPPSGGYPISGPVHNPSTGIPHGHAVGRHHDSFTPYGRVNGMTPQHNLHPQSYVASPGPPSNSTFPYNEQMYNDPLHMMNSPSSWGQNPENVGFDNTTFPSMCGCGDDCACPGCVHHNSAADSPSSSAYASCHNPNHCATCLDCTIMSLPASAFLPADTALSISDSQNDAIDNWLRQMSASISSTADPSSLPPFHQGFNGSPFQPPSGWNSPDFPYGDQPLNMGRDPRGLHSSNPNFNHNNGPPNLQIMGSYNPSSHDRRQAAFPAQSQAQQGHHRSHSSMSNHDMIDPRLLPSPNSSNSMLGGGPFLTLQPDHSRSRSPSTSSQSSQSDGCCGPPAPSSVGGGGGGGAIPPYRPSGRMQGMFPTPSPGVARCAPQLNIRPGMARGPPSSSSSSLSPSPGSSTRGRAHVPAGRTEKAASEYDPSLAGLQIY